MKIVRKVDLSKLVEEFGGYKQLAFWSRFATTLYRLGKALDALLCIGLFIYRIVLISETGFSSSSVISVVTGLIGLAILFAVIYFVIYVSYMLKQLLLSYFYDIKQQRIALERLTLLECGEVCENESLKKYAGESMIKHMDIKSIDLSNETSSDEF